MAQQADGHSQPFSHQVSNLLPDLDSGIGMPMHSKPFDIPQPNSRYGVPKDESHTPLSPVTHLTTLDAPLPASFESNGISYIARHGPIAASVPVKFGLESPPPSLTKKSYVPGTLRTLQDSAFGQEGQFVMSNLGSSPMGPQEDGFGRRAMHSQKVNRPQMMSASLPQLEDDLMFGGEEDYVPANLVHLLNDGERTRRASGKTEDPMSIRRALNGDFSSKVGSPGGASPSRYSALFKEQSGSPFGHVGSPLRNGSMHLGTSPGRSVSRTSNGDLAFQVASPPRSSGMSALSQQFQQTRLSNENSSSLHPVARRHASFGSRATYERAVSSSSVNTNRIDEEGPELVFTIDEDDYNSSAKASPRGPSKATPLGSIGDGRITSLNGEATKESPKK